VTAGQHIIELAQKYLADFYLQIALAVVSGVILSVTSIRWKYLALQERKRRLF
jgi:hypothetical protein